MYDEKSDFIHHEREIKTFFEITHLKDKCNNMTILDIGAGLGMHCGFLAKYFNFVYASDIINYSYLYNGEFLKLLNEKHIRNNQFYDLHKIAFIETDAMNMLYKDCMFDVVLSINTFEHIPDTYKAMEEIIRVTADEGYIYITFDPIWTADSGSHFYHLIPEPWEHLVNEKFEQRILSVGGTMDQAREYRTAMNRRRLNEHRDVFQEFIEKGSVELLYSNSWKGVTDEKNNFHENFKKALQLNYTEEELLTRGLCYFLKKKPISSINQSIYPKDNISIVSENPPSTTKLHTKTVDFKEDTIQLQTPVKTIHTGIGAIAKIPVTILNGTKEPLLAKGEGVTHLSYHIANQDGFVLFDGFRTKIRKDLAVNSRNTYLLEVHFKNLNYGKGCYLEIAAVKENGCWYEGPKIPVEIDPAIDTTVNTHLIFDDEKQELYPIFRPKEIVIENINTCTNDCIICAHSLSKRHKEIMSIKVYQNVLENYVQMGGGSILITPMIGEVFMDNYLDERIKLLDKYPAINHLKIYTNLTSLKNWDDKRLKYVVDNCDDIIFSIYGLDQKEYAQMTRRNTYSQMVENGRRIIQLIEDPDKITAEFRLLKDHSKKEIERWIEANWSIQLKHMETNEFSNWGGDMDLDIPLPFSGKWRRLERGNEEPCAILFDFTQIFSDGGISLCACCDYDRWEELNIGNVKENSLVDALNSKKALDIISFKDEMVKKRCKNCTFHQAFYAI